MTGVKSQKEAEIQAVFFDMDDVLFDGAWPSVFKELGALDEGNRLKSMYLSGQFQSYMQWSEEACRVFQLYGLTKDTLTKIVDNAQPTEGAEYTLKELKRRGYKTGVISGGIKALASRAKDLFDLDYAVAHCDIIFGKNGTLEGWNLIPCDCEGKADYLNDLIKAHGLNPKQCAYVGHEDSDLPVMKEVGFSIAFNSDNDYVKEAADAVVDKKDLREILQYFLSRTTRM